ncbi:hypothetical protein TrVFT333_005664 [Trichoderma virens FT-333]|nr:hypothetical protein TrVFT333_005664 [Trichoderma virens FT-333]
MALAINDRIIDHISEDLLHIPEREFQEQPELEVDCRKYDALPKLPNLAAAADEGCQFCAFLMVFVLNCYYQLLDSNTDGTSDESESSQLSATIDKIRYVRENDPNVAGFVTRHAQTGIIGLAANVHIYHEELEEQLFHTTVWLPVRANDSK